jgi:hypothetical protein
MLAFTSSTEGVASGAEELRYSWDRNHAPVSGLERDNSNWWKERAERQGTITSGDATVDSQRNQIRRVQTNQTNGGVGRSFKTDGFKYSRSNFKYRTLSKGQVFETKRIKEIKGGVNFEHNKDVHYTHTALHPAGPVNTEDNVFVPKNVLLGFTEDLVALEDTSDPPINPSEKIKRTILVQHGRDWEDGVGYKNTKSSFSFPFNIISSSVKSGYNKQVLARVTASVEITNVHNDVYGPDMERPMQGPFTDYAVGGHQSRHIKLNDGGDNYLNRPEAWKILLGLCGDITGAVGMVGADYPYPEANDLNENPYPLTGAQKATYYRDQVAKRPVNIRNIQHRTGSTILGNYNHNYEVVHTVGGYSNPRAFIDEQPDLPQIAEGADVVKTILDINRGERGHFTFVDDYNAGYLTGSGEYKNKTVIVNRFSAPGSRESSTRAFKDFRASELSVYNTVNNRNWTSRRPYQGATSSIVSETEGIRSFDHTGRDFGFTNLAARHAGKFFRDSVFQTNPGSSDDAFQEEPSFHKIHRNSKIHAVSGGVSSKTKHDNLNVQHQIPQSDRQYSWFTSSITNSDPSDPRYSGFMLTDSGIAPYYDITGTLVPFFEYVSASSIQPNGLFQNTTRLNIRVIDPVFSNSNTLGSGTIEQTPLSPGSWINTRGLRNLLMRRGDIYGWNWRAFRQQDHPVLRTEHQNNRLTALKGTELKDFRLPPVSMKGRPVVVNMDAQGLNISLKATHNNEKIYFNERELNDLVYPMQDTTITPFDQLIDMSNQPGNELNWVHYSETLFPSTRNEFSSGSRERIGFDNGFWRDSNEDRLTYESNSFNINVSQSIWSLDAQEDFLTRTQIVYASIDVDSLIKNGKSGELQNNYTTYFTSSDVVDIRKNLRAGSLMSRKQLLTSPNSVVSRTGFAQTASLTDTFADQIPNYAGEALWEAGTHATIIEKTASGFITASHPSEPWFDEYGDFKEELQLVAKDYSIIPEFRISEHISDYIKGGVFNKTKQDTFQIPGTDIDSNDTDFYKDYSNSDFLKEFAEVKQKSGLGAKEIMLTCKAAIRYNPYKGFYPAQRTINLAEQFNSSFSQGFSKTAGSGLLPSLTDDNSRYLRPLIQPLFAPGIVYNSIKSGIAVDYPIINNGARFQSINLSGSGTGENYCIFGSERGYGLSLTASEGGFYDPSVEDFWNYRVPFETIIEPGKYIDKVEFVDFEPHPSSSINATASLDASVSDGIYELMSKNFFGQTADFFLKNSGFTRIESDLIQDGLRFKSGEVYAARLKIRKSHNGNRYYNYESGSDGTNDGFTSLGAKAFTGTSTSAVALTGGYFMLPQDPAHNPDFEETFTMYSRPTAFGPSVSGRTENNQENSFLSGTLDSLEGYNWAYTPPYYHGESWVDFVFRPESGKEYTLEDILSETETVYWRVDPGQKTTNVAPSSYAPERRLITNGRKILSSPSAGDREIQAPYGGNVINDNAMQLNSSLNLFGVERVAKKRKDKFNNTILDQNEIAGKRWIIQPKWETPMLNFANVESGSGNITYPNTFSESVPRGIWHQFGEIPEDPATGVFLEIGDIPVDWLKGHYDVINIDSVYNNDDAASSGSTAFKDIKSLSDLFGFSRAKKKDSANVRLGEIADKREVYEAVVAIPYVIEANETYGVLTGNDKKNRKKFISIPRERFESALKRREGSQDGDSLLTAGESIRKMVQKMKRYVLPPQFDFINFEEIDPMVMYFFEFKYEFDKDDLSYIWQNLAPREYKKITFQEAKVSHDLMNNELLDEDNLMDNPNLRWMVFKVKQKAGKDYYDLIAPQVKAARPTSNLDKPDTDKDDEYLQFNWPYDYLSFVELVKLEADVLYKADDEVPE